MPVQVRRIRVGQQWTKDETGETYLVTKLYNEALHTVAVLRKAGAETEALLRVKIQSLGDGQTLPGFTPLQPSDDL